ncbi:MAG TPA: hypothetical protein VGA09_24270 [Candidatus Binatia bacterium]
MRYEGRGAFTFANGNCYEREFKSSMPNGHGTLKTTTGEVPYRQVVEPVSEAG